MTHIAIRNFAVSPSATRRSLPVRWIMRGRFARGISSTTPFANRNPDKLIGMAVRDLAVEPRAVTDTSASSS